MADDGDVRAGNFQDQPEYCLDDPQRADILFSHIKFPQDPFAESMGMDKIRYPITMIQIMIKRNILFNPLQNIFSIPNGIGPDIILL